MDFRRIRVDLDPKINGSLKLAWAKKHLDALNLEVGSFLKGKTHELWTEDDLETGEYVVHLDPEPLRAELGLMAGDFVSCLRASLDHLACALTLAPGGTRNDSASFPVIAVNNSKGRKSFKDALIGVHADPKAIIERLQPYHGGDAYKLTKLWKLHRLWNIDKHRRIPLYAAGAQMLVAFPTNMPPISSRSNDSNVMRFPIAAKPDVKLNPAIKFNIYFGDDAEGIIIPAGELVDIYEFVRNKVFPQLRGFF